jgi:hypothetical protein
MATEDEHRKDRVHFLVILAYVFLSGVILGMAYGGSGIDGD